MSIQALVLYILMLPFLCAGCGEKKMPIAHFIVPVGFRGCIVIIEKSPGGIVVPRTEEREIYEVPKSGILKIAGRGPFTSWQNASAEWSDGSRLLTDLELMGKHGYLGDPNKTIALWGVATDEKGESWMYVGPKSEYLKAAGDPLGRRPGEPMK